MTKQCVICGSEYEPRRKNQPTCGCEGCKRKWRLIYKRKYDKSLHMIKGVDSKVYKREKMREYRARAKGEEYVPSFGGSKQLMPEEPTLDASTYAERQRAKTLARAGKVQI